MSETNTIFAESIPALYDGDLGPLFFEAPEAGKMRCSLIHRSLKASHEICL